MSVKFNSEESSLYTLIGGGPQGSWNGMNCYIAASDDSADCVSQDNRYKYCDDLTILELVMIGDILTEYNFVEHVASDIGINQQYLPAQSYETQTHLNNIAQWSSNNLAKINELKTNYIVFSRAKSDFATIMTINDR